MDDVEVWSCKDALSLFYGKSRLPPIPQHNLTSMKPRVDTGLGKKLPTKKQLMKWKKQVCSLSVAF